MRTEATQSVRSAQPKTSSAAAPPATLLPSAKDIVLDPIEMLAKLTSEQRALDMTVGTTKVESNRKEKAQAFKEFQEAAKKAKEARENASFFSKIASALGTVGTIVAAVAAVASIVVTGGASLPAVLALASASMSAMAMANKEFGIIGGKAGETLNTVLTIGAAAAGIASAGCGIFNIGASLASGAGTVARGVAYTAKGAQIAGGVVQAGAATTSGVAHVYNKEASDADTNAGEKNAHAARMQREQQALIAQIKSFLASHERAMDTVVDVINNRNETQFKLATIRG
jgi:hypothetical protein